MVWVLLVAIAGSQSPAIVGTFKAKEACLNAHKETVAIQSGSIVNLKRRYFTTVCVPVETTTKQ